MKYYADEYFHWEFAGYDDPSKSTLALLYGQFLQISGSFTVAYPGEGVSSNIFRNSPFSQKTGASDIKLTVYDDHVTWSWDGAELRQVLDITTKNYYLMIILPGCATRDESSSVQIIDSEVDKN